MSDLRLIPCSVCQLDPRLCICDIGPDGRYVSDRERAERATQPPSEAVARGMAEIAALRVAASPHPTTESEATSDGA